MVHVIIECHANNAFADHNTLLVHVKSNDTKEMKINFLFHILRKHLPLYCHVGIKFSLNDILFIFQNYLYLTLHNIKL